MPTYYVKTIDGKVTGVKADYFIWNRENLRFVARTTEVGPNNDVAYFPSHSVLSVVEENADQGTFDPSEGDTCLRCQFKEFLESDELFDTVYDIVNFWHEPDEDEAPPPPQGVN